MRKQKWLLLLVPPLLALAMAACDENDNANITGTGTPRTFVQVDRLGNPLVSEATFPKRDHGFHNATNPSTDLANGFDKKVAAFVTGVAGRKQATANLIASVLIPDMLIVQTDKPGSTAGWLSWALANGYGGRKLTDDVVDMALGAIFGPALDPDNVSPGLTSDHVDANDRQFSSTFPYLATPNN